MCLQKVYDIKPDKDAIEVWYKLYLKIPVNNLYHPGKRYKSPYQSHCVNIGDWVENDTGDIDLGSSGSPAVITKASVCNVGLLFDGSSRPYSSGFHFYDRDAILKTLGFIYSVKIVAVECIVSDITAYGMDQLGEACVAQSFRPMREVTRGYLLNS